MLNATKTLLVFFPSVLLMGCWCQHFNIWLLKHQWQEIHKSFVQRTAITKPCYLHNVGLAIVVSESLSRLRLLQYNLVKWDKQK